MFLTGRGITHGREFTLELFERLGSSVQTTDPGDERAGIVRRARLQRNERQSGECLRNELARTRREIVLPARLLQYDAVTDGETARRPAIMLP